MPQASVQDTFLNQVRKQKVPMTIFLVNGFQIKGNIASFDNFTVLVASGGKQQMIYKHAISTIIPDNPVGIAPEKSND
jgi:host factor-I protein